VGVRLLLRALCVAAMSARVASWLEAQDPPPSGITAPMPLGRPPVVLPQTPAPREKPVRLAFCQPSGATDHPSLWVLDGVRLGLRPDGTVDHEVACRLLSQLDPKQIASIQVLRGAEAVARFGPGAHEAAVLIKTRLPDSSRKDPSPPKPANP